MKKALLLVLSALVALPFSFVPTSQAAFKDVSPSDVYYNQINYLKDNNIVSGYNDGTFGEENQIKRNEFIKILVNSKFSQTVINTCLADSSVQPFSDVPVGDVFAPYICVAKKYNIISGYSDGTFKPYNNVTYPEAAKILIRTFYNYDIPAAAQLNTYTQKIDELNMVPVTVKSAGDYNSVQLKRGEMASLVYSVKEEKPNSEHEKYFGTDPGNIISFDAALKLAEEAVPGGEIEEVELQQDGALLLYRAVVGNTVVEINAKDGVVENRYQNNEEDNLDAVLVSGLISTDEALNVAKNYIDMGEIIDSEVDLEREGNTYIYTVELDNGKESIEFDVNAKTKEVIGTEYGDLTYDSVNANILSPDQILSRALANSFITGLGQIDQEEVELKKESKNYFYVIDVKGANDEDIEIEFNADNGDIVSVNYEYADEDEENDNEDENDNQNENDSEDENDGEDINVTPKAGQLSQAEAEQVALDETGGGTVKEVDLEGYNTGDVYAIVVRVNGVDREIGVDAETGEVKWNKLDD